MNRGDIGKKEYSSSVLASDELESFFNHLLDKGTVIAPKIYLGRVEFLPVTEFKRVHLDTQATVGPKDVVLPRTEALFTFRNKIDEPPVVEEAKTPKEKMILFGLRPCDAHGIVMLDAVFEQGIKDSVYGSKRKETVLVGMACTAPGENCFCTSVGGSPGDTRGMDIFLTDIGDDGFLVEVCSKKGASLIEGFELFSPVDDAILKKRDGIIEDAEKSIKKHPRTENIQEVLKKRFDTKEYWERISETCIGCGACTFLCPTCYCFDMQDVTNRSGGARLRIWDSCMYEEYTNHTSGYNPRPERSSRWRNRLCHKFWWEKEEYGEFGCTGCGRCITCCPVTIDITELLDRAWEEE